MARHTDIQYIRFYTDGSAARELSEQTNLTAPAVKPRPRKKRARVRRIYPVETLASVTAVVLVVMMIVGMVQCISVNRENARLASYVADLQSQNEYLEEQYNTLVDLEEIEKTALAIGMVPASEVEQISIAVQTPAVTPEPNLWQSLTAFLTALFA